MMEILVDCLPGFEPVYKHEGDAGADLRDDGHAKFIPIKKGEAGSDA